MYGFERTLKTVASKSEMHRLIDEMPDDAEALLLVNEHATNRFVRLNMPDWGHVVYWLRYFEHAIFSGEAHGLREGDDEES